MEAKKVYSKPLLVTTAIRLGVFGEYGDVPGGNNGPRPIKDINPFDFTIE